MKTNSSRPHMTNKTRSKPRVNCGPLLTSRVRTLTSDLFSECNDAARAEIPFPSDEDLNTYGTLGNYMDKIRLRSSEIYQERIKTLPTKDLEDILWVHECG